MRSMRVPALVLGVLLAASAGGVAWQEMRVASEAAGAQNTELRTAAAGTQTRLSSCSTSKRCFLERWLARGSLTSDPVRR